MSTTFVDAAKLIALEAEIVAVAGALATTRYRLLELVGRFDAVGGWVATGAVSCAHWLAGLLDIEVCTARDQVRCAQALRALPVIRDRFATGELSYAKVRQLVRVATADNEAELVEIARQTPAGYLGRALAHWQHRHDPDGLRDRQEDARSVTHRVHPDGTESLTVHLPPDQMATVLAAIDVETRRSSGPSAFADASDHPSLAQQRADAFGRIIRRATEANRGSGASADASRPRSEVVIHRRVGEFELADGTPLHPDIARQVTCDTDLRVMTHYPDGSPADVGRRHRLVTPRLRRLVHERDRHCQNPGCRSTLFLDVHHIVHWEDGGPTDLDNLTVLCDHHHRHLHRHGYPRGSGRPPQTLSPTVSDGGSVILGGRSGRV